MKGVDDKTSKMEDFCDIEQLKVHHLNVFLLHCERGPSIAISAMLNK
jgi:hypothetical protein